jgi:hypothetical protein
MNSRKHADLKKTVQKIYDFIGEGLYLNRPDMEIKGERFNSTLLMSLLTGLCQGKELVIGEPGLGKTTSAEYACSLLYRFPLGTIWGSEVSGHPEQTEEKIIGRPDLGRLTQGEEVVIWSHFAQLPIKIVDEINRLPETKQSLILDGVDRGNWEYLNDAIINREYCLFATANYEDRGTNTIIAPLVDRFDVMVESQHPGPNMASIIGTQGDRGQILRHEGLEEKFQGVLAQKTSYSDQMKQIEALCDQFGEVITKVTGIQTLSRPERQSILSDMEKIPFDLDSNAYLRFVISELSFCYWFGQKRSNEVCDDGCHFTGYLCNKIRNCISNRLPTSVRKFSQALAWFLGDEEVKLRHLTTVLPFTLAHRTQWKEESIAQAEKEIRSNPVEIYMAKGAVSEMSRRYVEQSQHVKEALAVAGRINEGEACEPLEGDHPIYWEIRKDLGEEITTNGKSVS